MNNNKMNKNKVRYFYNISDSSDMNERSYYFWSVQGYSAGVWKVMLYKKKERVDISDLVSRKDAGTHWIEIPRKEVALMI